MPLKIQLTLGDDDLKYFRSEIKKSRDMSEELGDEAIIDAARKMVDTMSSVSMPEFVSERVEKLASLIEMVSDDKWDLPKSISSNVISALAYFVHPQDIIPDDVPALGFLDDAIMIELIVRELRHDIEAYQEFMAFGRMDKERPGGDTGEIVDSQAFKQTRDKLRRRARRRFRADRASRSPRSRLF